MNRNIQEEQGGSRLNTWVMRGDGHRAPTQQSSLIHLHSKSAYEWGLVLIPISTDEETETQGMRALGHTTGRWQGQEENSDGPKAHPKPCSPGAEGQGWRPLMAGWVGAVLGSPLQPVASHPVPS